MALRIPAAQVPFVRRYFQLLNSFAENSPAGEDLVIERDLLSELSNTQVEGFQRLLSYYQSLPNNIRNNTAQNNSASLLRYFRNLNANRIVPAVYRFFLGLEQHQIQEKMEALSILCQRFSQMELEPQGYRTFFHIAPFLDDFAQLYASFTLLDIDQVFELGNQVRAVLGEIVPLSVAEADELGDLILRLCEMNEAARVEFISSQLEAYRTRETLVGQTALNENNLRGMTNYLRFGSNTSGGKRRGRKTRKHRKV